MSTPSHNRPETARARWESFRFDKEALAGLRRVLEADGATLPASDEEFELIANQLFSAVAEVYGDALLPPHDALD